jgi:hypothetical protein
MEDILKNKIVSEQLSSVEFVQDYLQLHFDGKTITAYVWPQLIHNNEISYFGDSGYRDKLCNFIGKEVKDLFYTDKQFLVLYFNEIYGSIKINLDAKNPEIVSEIAVFNDPIDNTWAIFD